MKRSEVPDNRKRFTWEEVQEVMRSNAIWKDLHGHNKPIADEFITRIVGALILLEKGYCIHGELPDDCPDCRH